MLRESDYDKIDLYSATKGMNQNIAPDLLKPEHSYYIENIMPLSLGEGQVRYGTSLFSQVPTDKIIAKFPFSSESGSKQQVLYFNGYQNFAIYTNFRIVSSSHIVLTSPNYALFKKDTLLKLSYTDLHGLSPDLFYQIKKITNVVGHPNTIDIEFQENSFPDALEDFYIQAVTPNPQYIDGSHFSITVPDDFIADLYYFDGQKLKLSIDAVVTDLVIANNGVDDTVEGQITFTTTLPDVPNFNDGNVRLLRYGSFTPLLSFLANSYGYIKVLDVATNTLLPGVDQTLSGLSVACVPRSEYFAKKLWICNGVNDVMTWDGEKLEVYEEEIKERAGSFNRINDTKFSFIPDASFDISKYQDGKSIRLVVTQLGATIGDVTTVVSVVAAVGLTIEITTVDDIPDFTGQDVITLFYFDKLPKFSFMKGAHDRLWCLPEGAVSLEYRVPDLAMRFYYSYKPFSDEVDFKFFNEKTKTVPSEDISAKHGVADNLEAIVQRSSNLVFMGRQASQVWSGIDPLTEGSADYFKWSVNLPVGVYHGSLVVELANDSQFLTQNGFQSFSTLNVAKQFAASNTPNMDKLATEYLSTIDDNYQYRSCASFKYNGGGFCGFKIGQNDIIVSKFHTSFFWWGIFSGDFSAASCFLSTLDDCLYLSIGNKIYRYADGFGGSPIMYGDQDETRFINFIETKYVNNIKNRYANKRYEIDCDYSSSIVINTENTVNIYISGNLRNSFVIQDLYKLPLRGDLLGTINLVDGSTAGEINLPDSTAIGMRFDSPSHPKKGRLKFVSNKFAVTIAGQIKNGPFVLKKIRLLGMLER
jgi:hypothetical protein